MDRFQPTTFWGVTAFRLWRAAALSWTGYAASYAAMAKAISSGRKGRQDVVEEKPVAKQDVVAAPAPKIEAPKASSAPVVVKSDAAVKTIGVVEKAQNQSAPQSKDEEPFALKPSVAPATGSSAPAPQAQPASAPASNSAVKQFNPQSGPHGKSGKKKNRPPQAKGFNALPELREKLKEGGGPDSGSTTK